MKKFKVFADDRKNCCLVDSLFVSNIKFGQDQKYIQKNIINGKEVKTKRDK